jgi:hypothetical protein
MYAASSLLLVGPEKPAKQSQEGRCLACSHAKCGGWGVMCVVEIFFPVSPIRTIAGTIAQSSHQGRCCCEWLFHLAPPRGDAGAAAAAACQCGLCPRISGARVARQLGVHR